MMAWKSDHDSVVQDLEDPLDTLYADGMGPSEKDVSMDQLTQVEGDILSSVIFMVM